MDENSWLTGTDPRELLTGLHPPHTLGSVRPQTRLSRLYLVACARRQWARLPHVCRVLVELAEIVANSPIKKEPLRVTVAAIAAELMSDGDSRDFQVAEEELDKANITAELKLARQNVAKFPAPEPQLTCEERRQIATLMYLPFELNTPPYKWVSPELHSLELLREVYGNPCRWILFEAEWRTTTALLLAKQMYLNGRFCSMPILADALQDAGCNNEVILNHCREPGEHVRGCWVLDSVLMMR